MKRGGGTTRRGRGGRRASDGPAFDVLALREALGKPHGIKAASRSMLAELIGASEGSVLNWEKGKPPTEKYAARLRELAEKAASGSVSLPHRNRGGRRPRGASAGTTNGGASAAPARGRRGRPAASSSGPAPSISGESPVLYANHLQVASGPHDARITFALVLPGQSGARAVASVLVPRDVLESLRV